MKKLILLAFLLLPIFKSSAWGEKGHAMVAKVAFSYLDENTKKNVLSYLDGMTIEEAANWMDNIKGDKSKDFKRSRGAKLKRFRRIVWERGKVAKVSQDCLGKGRRSRGEKLASSCRIFLGSCIADRDQSEMPAPVGGNHVCGIRKNIT